MADIAPELYEKIKESFDEKYAQAQLFGNPLASVFEEIKAGTANFTTADLYAVEVGSMMADSMKEVLKLDDLPGGQLYRNIAQRTVGEGLKDVYGLVSNISATIQEEINGKIGIGLKAVKPKLETDRVDKIVNRTVSARTQTALENNLTDTVPTFARQVVDDTQKANARLHDRAGLEVKVERKYDGVGLHKNGDVCQWCKDREGTFTYDEAMEAGAFQRHEGCGCIITYTSKKGEITKSTGKWTGWNKAEERIDKEQKIVQESNNLKEYAQTKGRLINQIIQTGGKDSGGKHYVAYNPYDPRDVKAAEEYRKISRRNDIEAVAKTVGHPIEDAKQVKRHVFFEKHQLEDGYRLLDPDFDMAVAWNRIAEGKPEERDLLLFEHELLESQLEKAYNLTLREAHERAQKVFNWEARVSKECPEGEKYDLL